VDGEAKIESRKGGKGTENYGQMEEKRVKDEKQ
jgi:hypothetical protein